MHVFNINCKRLAKSFTVHYGILLSMISLVHPFVFGGIAHVRAHYRNSKNRTPLHPSGSEKMESDDGDKRLLSAFPPCTVMVLIFRRPCRVSSFPYSHRTYHTYITHAKSGLSVSTPSFSRSHCSLPRSLVAIAREGAVVTYHSIIH